MAELDPNACLAALAQRITAGLSPAANRAVYAYRTMPSLAEVSLYLSYLGGRPAFATAGGHGAGYLFSIVLDVHHDGTEAGRAAAEQTINELEYQLYALLEAAGRDPAAPWLGSPFPKDSTRPPSPESLKDSRLGELFLRVHTR